MRTPSGHQVKIFKQSQTLFMQIPITKAAESSGTCLIQQFSFTKVRERWASGPVTFVSHHRLVLSLILGYRV